MQVLWPDLLFAFRTLRRNFWFMALVIASLALAIAGNTIVFSLVNGLLYRPLPFDQPERILVIGEREAGGPGTVLNLASTANLLDWRERQSLFEDMAGFRPVPRVLTDGERPESIQTGSVTPAFFPVMGTAAIHGRLFREEEGVPGNDKVAVLSRKFWADHYALDPGVLGKVIEIEGEPFEVIGVLPEDFEFIDPKIRLWLPLAIERSTLVRERRDIFALARLKAGVSQEETLASMSVIVEQLAEEFPVENRGYEVDVLVLRERIPDASSRRLLSLLQAALICVLLIACANTANVLLAHGQRREREIAVRSSLGAGRGRIVAQLMTESLILACCGGALGLALAAAGVKVLSVAMANFLPRNYAPVIDGRVVLFTLVVTVVGGLLFGIIPSLRTTRLNLVESLKEGLHSTGKGRRGFLNRALVVVEIAVALMLLGGAGILIRSFLDLQHRNPGFETQGLVTFQLNLPASRYADEPTINLGTQSVLERLAALPGIDSAAASNSLPRTPYAPTSTFSIDSRPLAEDQSPPRALWLTATAQYFDTLGIALRQGRYFTSADRLDSTPVAVINQAMALRFWPDGNPLGESITVEGRSREIVGIADDVLHSFLVQQEKEPAIYVPQTQTPNSDFSLILRTRLEPGSLFEAVRGAVVTYDPNLAVPELQTFDQFIAQSFAGTHVFSGILGGFGILALLMAAVGTYGVQAYLMSQRTHEIGVRLAMGAGRRQVLGLVTRQGLKLAVAGITLGFPGVLLVSRIAAAALAEFVPIEPLTIVGIALLLVFVVALASLMPARRASNIDPVQALRSE